MAGPALPLLGLAQLFSGFTDIIGGAAEADAIRAQASFNKMQAETNARLAEMNAGEAIVEGEKLAEDISREGRRVQGTQRAGYAAQGVDVNSGSAVDVQAETAGNVASDLLTIKNNAWKKAWGYRVEAQNQRLAGFMGQVAGENRANATILTSGLKAFSSGLSGAGYLYGGAKGTK